MRFDKCIHLEPAPWWKYRPFPSPQMENVFHLGWYFCMLPTVGQHLCLVVRCLMLFRLWRRNSQVNAILHAPRGSWLLQSKTSKLKFLSFYLLKSCWLFKGQLKPLHPSSTKLTPIFNLSLNLPSPKMHTSLSYIFSKKGFFILFFFFSDGL